jgi:hypothetical protein
VAANSRDSSWTTLNCHCSLATHDSLDWLTVKLLLALDSTMILEVPQGLWQYFNIWQFWEFLESISWLSVCLVCAADPRQHNHSWFQVLQDSWPDSQVKATLRLTSGDQSISIWGSRPDFCYCQKVAVLSMWGTLPDKRTGLSFTTVKISSASSIFTILYVSILHSRLSRVWRFVDTYCFQLYIPIYYICIICTGPLLV